MRPFTRKLRQHLPTAVLAALAAWLFHLQFSFGVNISPSLPQQIFLIHRGEAPARGDYVAFRWQGGGPHRAGTPFVKVLAGVPGDTVERLDRRFFLNGRFIAVAKKRGRDGQALEAGPEGVLPPGRYYVHAAHPDSLDSRYALTGWISREQIIGRAYALF